MAKIKKKVWIIPNIGKDVGPLEFSFTVGENIKYSSTLEKTLKESYKTKIDLF